MTWFSEKMLIYARCIHGFTSNLIKKSWTDSSLGIKRDEETTATATKIDSNPRSRASVYEAISLQNEADYFLSSAGSKKDSTTTTSDSTTTVDVEIEYFDHPKIVQHFDEKIEQETEVVKEQLTEEPVHDGENLVKTSEWNLI